jgi:hypothetical protein
MFARNTVIMYEDTIQCSYHLNAIYVGFFYGLANEMVEYSTWHTTNVK